MRILAILLGIGLLLGAVAVPAVAAGKVQPKVDIAAVGWALYGDVVNGDAYTKAKDGFMWAEGPGNYTFFTSGNVTHTFNPVLSRDEFDIIFGDVTIVHAKDNTMINVYQESFTYDMYTNCGGCGTVTCMGDGTLRVGGRVWTGAKTTPVTLSFRSRGANCP